MPDAVPVERLRDYVRRRLFTPHRPGSPPRVGVEVEAIVVDARTRRPLPVRGDGPCCGVALVRDAARSHGWVELAAAHGAPRWRTATGGVVGFEPGGQVEYGTVPFRSLRALLDDVIVTLEALRDSAADRGAELLEVGIDPWKEVADVPLQLDDDRYRRMDAYFAAFGGAGRRMMRQTAALQVNLDLGDDEEERWLRWRVLGRASPYVAAAFANSRCHAGSDSGHASHRAITWLEVDPQRTGVVAAGSGLDEAVEEYTRFALAAPWMLDPRVRAPSRPADYAPFAAAIASGSARAADWRTHLTTLFPDVRPRGWLELRSIDALPVSRMALPVMTLSGLVYDRAALRAADERIPEPDADLARRSASAGMDDPVIASVARDLVGIGMAGHARLPSPLRCDERACDSPPAWRSSWPRAAAAPP
ncbi:MAG TPA: glutamate-cysteine ligase family protein [Gemmatimonadales bacterium]